MTPERWQQVKEILHQALERGLEDRNRFLREACRGDASLRQEVDLYLASQNELGDFIENPVFSLHAEPVEELGAGDRIDRYEVEGTLGRGGMGVVYLARRVDEEFEQRVAIKVIKRGMDTREIVSRFRNERQILSNLRHPNIATLLDGGTTADGRPYLVMEYVEGQSLLEDCAQRRLDLRTRLELFCTVCEAVHFAHRNLVVHRDLKPGNILVTGEGVAKLLDFGIAKLLSPDNGQSPTATVGGLKLLTPQYASPEQLQGRAVTTASDVYSLGVILYELLTGQRPYPEDRSDGGELSTQRLDPERPSSAVRRGPWARSAAPEADTLELDPATRPPREDPDKLRRRLRGDLDNIVLKAMHREPERRYASAVQLAEDLQLHLQGRPVMAAGDSVTYRVATFVRRHKWGVAMAAGIFVLLLAFIVTLSVQLRATREARDEAQGARDHAQRVAAYLEELFQSSEPDQAKGGLLDVAELLGRGRGILQDLEDEPELQADLMATLGRIHVKWGLYREALPLLEGALRLRRGLFGEDHLVVAKSQHHLAGLFVQMDRSQEARLLLEQALASQQANDATEDIDYAKGLQNLGKLEEDAGRFGAAEDLYRRALELKLRLLGPRGAEVATAHNSLGVVLLHRRRFSQAVAELRTALEIHDRAVDARTSDRAMILNNLAHAEEAGGDLERAESLYHEAVKTYRRIYVKDHPRLAKALNNLAFCLYRLDDPGAEAFYLEAIAIWERLEDRPWELALVRKNLALFYNRQGRYEKGRESARMAVERFIQAYNETHWRVHDTRTVLGESLVGLGRFDEAQELLVRSYEALEQSAPPEHRQKVQEARERVAHLYEAWGKPQSAAPYR